jgi:hypothetical protein
VDAAFVVADSYNYREERSELNERDDGQDIFTGRYQGIFKMDAIVESLMKVERQDILLICVLFLLVFPLFKSAIDRWSPYKGFPSVGKSRLLTLLQWEVPARLCLDKWAVKGYQMVRWFHG